MTDAPSLAILYLQVLNLLEECQVPYMIIGGFGATLYGSNRATHDVDILVQLKEEHIHALARRFPLPRYYADAYQMREAAEKGIMFAIVDSEAGQKVDLIPVTLDPSYSRALSRHVRVTINDPTGRPVDVWVARPDDIIIGKLKAWSERRSYRHEYDIEAILLCAFSQYDPQVAAWLDEKRVDRQVRLMGTEALNLWQQLKQTARRHARRKN